MRISVEGNIGAGKSTVLCALATALPGVPIFPEPVDEWEELLALFYASPAEWALPFSLKVLLSFCRASRETRCVVERSPVSCRHVFSQLLYNEGTLNCQEWELFKEYHDALAWKPDVIFFVDTPAEVCLERIAQRGRRCEAGVDLSYLRRVEFQYANMIRYADVPVVRFDGSLSAGELAEHVARAAHERLAGDARACSACSPCSTDA